MILIFVYLIVSVFVIIGAFSNAGASPGLCALGGSFLAFVSGAGLKGSFYGTKGQKIAGIVLALVAISIAHWLGYGFSVGLFGRWLAGYEWVWLGFILCLACTPRSMTYTTTS